MTGHGEWQRFVAGVNVEHVRVDRVAMLVVDGGRRGRYERLLIGAIFHRIDGGRISTVRTVYVVVVYGRDGRCGEAASIGNAMMLI